MNKLLIPILSAMIVVAPAAAPAAGQRDPAYAEARANGEVGEQPDGYLGIVGTPSDRLERLVSNINLQRKAAYTRGASSGGTVEQFAFTSGCNLILNTVSGEKYQTPGGTWKTRTAAAPERDPRCP